MNHGYDDACNISCLKGYWTFKSKGIVKLKATIQWKTLKKLKVKGWFLKIRMKFIKYRELKFMW